MYPRAPIFRLDNGLCAQNTSAFNVTQVNCECPPVYVSSTFTCDPATPGAYSLSLTVNSPGSDFVIGLGNGPAVPYSMYIPAGLQTVVMNVTMMMNPPTTIEMSFASGTKKCHEKVSVSPTYPCTGWPQEKPGGGNGKDDEALKREPMLSTGMLVFPNPATQAVSVNYHFGTGAEKRLVVYDLSGRRVASVPVTEAHGSHTLQVESWIPGIYLVRMEENGKAIHTQRLTISH
jgi:hypothetical protein